MGNKLRKKIYCMVGPNGSGKGTLGTELSKQGFTIIETGALCRTVAETKQFTEKGDYADDELVIKLVKKELENTSARTVVFDGFPRTLEQAEWLVKQWGVNGIIEFSIKEDVLIKRLSNRKVCNSCKKVHNSIISDKINCDCGSVLSSRPDDTPEKIKKRLELYKIETEPILKKINSKKLKIDSNPNNWISYQMREVMNFLN